MVLRLAPTLSSFSPTPRLSLPHTQHLPNAGALLAITFEHDRTGAITAGANFSLSSPVPLYCVISSTTPVCSRNAREERRPTLHHGLYDRECSIGGKLSKLTDGRDPPPPKKSTPGIGSVVVHLCRLTVHGIKLLVRNRTKAYVQSRQVGVPELLSGQRSLVGS